MIKNDIIMIQSAQIVPHNFQFVVGLRLKRKYIKFIVVGLKTGRKWAPCVI